MRLGPRGRGAGPGPRARAQSWSLTDNAPPTRPRAESPKRSMSTMKAAVLEAANAGLRIEEIPIPEPRAGEILVKVIACGVCHTDLHVMKAEVAFPMPAVMGHEISGTVDARGPGVAGSGVGAPVVAAVIMPWGTWGACCAGGR